MDGSRWQRCSRQVFEKQILAPYWLLSQNWFDAVFLLHDLVSLLRQPNDVFSGKSNFFMHLIRRKVCFFSLSLCSLRPFFPLKRKGKESESIFAKLGKKCFYCKNDCTAFVISLLSLLWLLHFCRFVCSTIKRKSFIGCEGPLLHKARAFSGSHTHPCYMGIETRYYGPNFLLSSPSYTYIYRVLQTERTGRRFCFILHFFKPGFSAVNWLSFFITTKLWKLSLL